MTPGPARRVRRGLAAVLLALAAIAATAPIAAADAPVAWPVQGVGDRGVDVLAIQHLLRARLTPADVALPPLDGVFGTATKSAVMTVQELRGLPITGVVDAATWTRLIGPVRPGSAGEAVRALQLELVAKRHAAVAITGRFDAATTTALRAFQAHMQLALTGVADSATWRALVWHYQLPSFGPSDLCDYSVGNGPANWGTAEAIAVLGLTGRTIVGLGFGRIAVGDVSFEHGGAIPGHETHRYGLDVDVRPLRKANDQCSVAGTTWRSASYDRAATRRMIQAFRAAAPGHIRLIYFNDPVLIGEGLTTWFTGHDDHLHVRFCEARHSLSTYDC